jgi:hypothetical protein
LDQAICRLANTGPAEPTTFNLSAIVGPAFSARNERRGLDVRRERNKSWNAQLRLTGAEYDHRPNRPRGPGPK